MNRLLILVLAVLAPSAGRAKEAFDVARYTLPAGWQQTRSPGMVALQSPIQNGSGAQIYLFASEPSRGTPEENFQAAWRKLVAAPFGVQPATTGTDRSSEGWAVVLGAAQYRKGGLTYRVTLATSTGEGRAFSVVVNLLGTARDAEVDAFFRDLDLVGPGAGPAGPTASAPAAAPPQSTPTADAGAVSLTPPRGWARTSRADAVAYVSPPYPNTGERCELLVLPLRRGSGELMRDATGTFQSMFQTDPMGGYPGVPPKVVRGTSPLGWPYVTIFKSLGRGGEETAGVILLVAGLGEQIATIVGVSKPPLVSQCFGEAFPSEWPAIFHSLSFRSFPPRPDDAQTKRRVAGAWTTFSAHAVDNLTLATNGRYQRGAALGNATRISATTVLWTMNTFRGDGTWAVKGQRLTLTSDRGGSEGGLFRIEELSDFGRPWVEQLCILGSTGDICYRREP